MTHVPNDPLDGDLADLFRRESGAYPVDPASRDRVFAKVEMVVGLGGSGVDGAARHPSAPVTAAPAALGKLATLGIAAFLAGAVVGGAAVAASTDRRPGPSIPTAPATNASSLPEPSTAPRPLEAPWTSAPPSRPIATANELPVVPPPAAVASSAAGAAGPARDLTREREVLDVARAALARGRFEDAILAAEHHAEVWPHGVLAEEREVIVIQALVAAGRRPEAEQRAVRFRRSFPASMLLTAVDVVLGADAATR